MADRPFDSGLPVIPEGETPAPAPAGTQAPFESGLPIAADPQSGWNLMSWVAPGAGARAVPSMPPQAAGGVPGGATPMDWGANDQFSSSAVTGAPQLPYGPANAMLHGATMGLSDPVLGFSRDIARGAAGGDFNFGQGPAEIKQERDQYATEHPVANIAANVAGGVVTAPLLPGARVFKAASELANPLVRTGATALAGAGLGAGYGGLGGAIDEAPTGDLGQIGTGARRGAEWGAAFGAGLPLAVGGIGEGARWLGQREWLPALFQGQRDVRAGQELQNVATDPASVIQAGEQRAFDPYTGMNVPGPDQARPTTAQLSGDVGIAGKERDLVAGIAARPESTWSPAERELVQKAQAQGEARATSLQGEIPEGADPATVKTAVAQRLSDMDAQHEANLTAAQQVAERAQQQLGQPMAPEGRGADVRAPVVEALKVSDQNEDALWRAIDPDKSLRIDARDVRDATNQIVRDTPKTDPIVPDSEEAKILGLAQIGGSAMPFNDFTALRGRLLRAIRTEREANGQTPSVYRMTQVRKAMEDTIANAAASNFDDGAAARYRAAADFTRQQHEQFGNQFIDPLLATRGSASDFKVPDVNVGGKIIANNQSAQAYLTAGGDPAMLKGALVDALNSRLRGGELTPQKLQQFRADREGAIRAVPGLDAELGNLDRAQSLVGQLTQARADTMKQARAGVVGRVADAGTGQDVRANVASILTGSPLGQTSRNSASEMMRLRAAIAGDPAAEAGLKGAVVQHISDRFIDPKTGDIKPGFLRFMQEKGPAIEAAVGSDSMRVLNALVADLERPQVARPDAVTSGRAAGAPTGLRAVLQQLGRPQTLGVGGAAAIGSLSHLAVGNPWVTASAVGLVLARALQRHGIANQAELLAQAMNNPALARVLMIKATQANAGMIERGINAALAGSHAAGGMTSDTNYGRRPPGGGSGGGTPPPEDLGAGSMEGEQSRPFAAGAPEATARFLLSGGDPEAQASAQASTAMQPAVLDYLHGMLSDSSEGLGQSTYDPSRSFAANALDPRSLDRATNIALGVGGPGAIRAFHASPYDFNAFDLSKVGTGQGSAVYGHGIYTAESPAVSGPGGSYDMEFTAKNLGKPDLNQGEAHVLRMLRANNSDLDIMGELGRSGYSFDEALSTLDKVKAARAKIYEVDINAQPEQFLNYDVPLAQQSATVRSALSSSLDPSQPLGAAVRRALQNEMYGGDLIGLPKASPPVISQILAERGVPGVRYLDQGSRNAGGWHITPPTETVSGKWMVKSNDYNSKGLHFDTEAEAQAALNDKIGGQTRNYAIFDDKLIDILRKYGLAAGGALGAGALYGSDSAQAANPQQAKAKPPRK